MTIEFEVYEQMFHPDHGVGTVRKIVDEWIVVSFDQNVTETVLAGRTG